MKRNTITTEERESRLILLQDFEQWRTATGSNSRMNFAKERGIELQYLLNCLKWYDQICKRQAKRKGVAHTRNKPDEFPFLVAVTKKTEPEPPKLSSSVAESAIRIRMRASSIDIAGDIAPTLLTQLLSTLGALNVL